MSKRLFVMKPWFWVAVSALIVFMLIGYFYALVVEGIRPIVVFEINSEPSDAFVYFDDDIIGRTPHRLEVEGRLSGNLKLVSEGYKDISRPIDIEPGKNESVMFHMKRDTKLTVNSKPQGANLYIDGDLWGSTPCVIEGFIDAGQHTLKVEMLDRCFGEVEKDIELLLGEEMVINSEELILPELNTVTINSQPQGATVTFGGEEWGKTPLTKCLPSGQYTISFEKESFATEEKQFELSSDASVYVKMLDPESYLKRNHFEVDANVETKVTMIPKKADNFSPIFGVPVEIGVSPTSIDSDVLMEKASIESKPFSYIVLGAAKGYEPGVTEMTGPGTTYFNLKELPSSSKSYQGKYKSSSTSNSKPNGLISPNSWFEIKADKNSAVLTANNGKTHNLYLQSDYKHNEFTWSDDSRWLWYFRNNEGKRELVRLDTESMEIVAIDSFDLSEFNASEIIPDNIFGCITSVDYSETATRIYYLVPGSVKDKLTLVSNSPAGGNKTVVAKNLVPVVDKWSVWLESSNVLKLTGYFPGLIKHDGYYLLDNEEAVHFEITSNPNSNIKVGQLKQVSGSDITMFPSAAFVKRKGKDIIISAQLYKGVSIVFVYHPTSDEYELLDVKID
ncbi:MAG: PEGA domain-containing protein [Caldisericia bacterium]